MRVKKTTKLEAIYNFWFDLLTFDNKLSIKYNDEEIEIITDNKGKKYGPGEIKIAFKRKGKEISTIQLEEIPLGNYDF